MLKVDSKIGTNNWLYR